MILSSDYPPFNTVQAAHPTAGEIGDAFDKLIVKADQKEHDGLDPRIGRRLYLYFSGHGFEPMPHGTGPGSGQPALLTADARDRWWHHILGPHHAEGILRANYFDQIVLIMDCCREIQRVSALNLMPSYPLGQGGVGGYFHAFATESDSVTRERLIDGQVRGVFTAALLDGLRGAAIDKATGQITAKSLSDWLWNPPRDEAAGADSNVIKPRIYSSEDRDTFVFGTMVPPDYPIRIGMPAGSKGKKARIRDGTPGRGLSIVRRTNNISGPSWKIELKTGTYVVEIPEINRECFLTVTGTGSIFEQADWEKTDPSEP